MVIEDQFPIQFSPRKSNTAMISSKSGNRKYDLNKITSRNSFCSKSVGHSTSKKKHDAPMRRGDMYFSLDCEMVGVGPEGLDSALARVSIVNWDGNVVLDTYVQVSEPVTDYRTFVSGIKEEHIRSDQAMPIEQVQSLVSKLLTGKILIGHALDNDLKALCLSHPWTDIRDTAKYVPFMTKIDSSLLNISDAPQFRPRKLKELVLEKLGMEIQTLGAPHSSVEDAMAAMALYKSVRSEWEQYLAKIVTKSYEMDSSMSYAYHDASYFVSKTIHSDNDRDSRTKASPNYHYDYGHYHDQRLNFEEPSIPAIVSQDGPVSGCYIIQPNIQKGYEQNRSNVYYSPFIQHGFSINNPSPSNHIQYPDFYSDPANALWR